MSLVQVQQPRASFVLILHYARPPPPPPPKKKGKEARKKTRPQTVALLILIDMSPLPIIDSLPPGITRHGSPLSCNQEVFFLQKMHSIAQHIPIHGSKPQSQLCIIMSALLLLFAILALVFNRNEIMRMLSFGTSLVATMQGFCPPFLFALNLL